MDVKNHLEMINLLIYGLFTDISNSDYIASSIDSVVTNKWERIWKETVVSNCRYFADIYLDERGTITKHQSG